MRTRKGELILLLLHLAAPLTSSSPSKRGEGGRGRGGGRTERCSQKEAAPHLPPPHTQMTAARFSINTRDGKHPIHLSQWAHSLSLSPTSRGLLRLSGCRELPICGNSLPVFFLLKKYHHLDASSRDLADGLISARSCFDCRFKLRWS
ncbi:uncharacterized protein [Physcomitrium patens]|uniref:Secreted protein n=2 Tax=Physcomitrium patens TaxID=3218 RepID=A0A2K1KNH0_PHYPA|nr:uncharacterized protein LOC112281134 [Physcomitrium patens]PNR55320.1 hypothetical protein PHYPA_006217 [Physcomitrium patens]|eukprot:XP_024373105.1 uncharacterized protein LOC112281134 [Physcomitrella patens]